MNKRSQGAVSKRRSLLSGQMPGLTVILSGPSGSGKSTLIQRLLRSRGLKNKVVKSISCTTRPRRSSEEDKKDYFFISERQFHTKLKAKKLLEWTRYLGYYYATPKDFLENQLERGKYILMCLDLRGALKVKRLYPKNTVAIFIAPPSLEALRDRIKRRCRHTREEEIQKRIKLARKELSLVRRYDYFVLNEDLEQATKQLRGVILKEIRTRYVKGKPVA